MKFKPKLKGRTLTFGSDGFYGGRRSVKWDGWVRIEFKAGIQEKEICVSVFDKLNTEDGHYAPLELSMKDAKLLRDWLNHQINAIEIDLHKLEHEEAQTQGANEHDIELLNSFAQFVSEHCNVQVQNMVRPFMEGDKC